MKLLRSFTLFCVALFSIACSYNELPENLKPATTFEDKITLNIETRAETYEGVELDQEYFVTATDLENFVNFRRKESKRSDFSVREVKSYGFDSSQTLFYILNYDKGWEVVASDKRVQPTLTHGDDGTFTMDTDNKPMKFWMNMLADGILKTRQSSDTATHTTTVNKPEEVNKYVQFWNDISHTSQNTRINIITPIWGPFNPLDSIIIIKETKKYYLPHLSDTTYSETLYGPYVETTWGQRQPWNQCCPYVRQNVHGLVGCVAVAAGQLLYHLVNRYNMEVTTYQNITCSGIYPDHTFSKLYPSTNLWQDMARYYGDASDNGKNYKFSAALLADIGEKIGIIYGDSLSTGYTSNIKTYLLDPLNITSTYVNYGETVVISELTGPQMPVIIDGTKAGAAVGHAWIIDGYRIITKNTKNYYILSTEEPSNEELSSYTKEDASGFEESSQTFYYFHMNWGWNGSDNGWYGLNTNSWSESGGQPYINDLDMLFNIRVQ